MPEAAQRRCPGRAAAARSAARQASSADRRAARSAARPASSRRPTQSMRDQRVEQRIDLQRIGAQLLRDLAPNRVRASTGAAPRPARAGCRARWRSGSPARRRGARRVHRQARRIGRDHRAEQHDRPSRGRSRPGRSAPSRTRRRPWRRSAPCSKYQREQPLAPPRCRRRRRAPPAQRVAPAHVACSARSGTAPPCRQREQHELERVEQQGRRRRAARRPGRATPRSRTR